ncbi:hypothetical protein ES703_98753 [subsurface metagenome]
MQAVEPASGLVNGFTDIIGGKSPVLKQGIILKWVVPLGYGHGSGIKPAINYLGHPPHLLPTLGAVKGYFINKGTV